MSCHVAQFCLVAPSFFFFFNDTATTEIYTLSLHDALPISAFKNNFRSYSIIDFSSCCCKRSEEHTSELQSRVDISYAVFCLKKKQYKEHISSFKSPVHSPCAAVSFNPDTSPARL